MQKVEGKLTTHSEQAKGIDEYSEDELRNMLADRLAEVKERYLAEHPPTSKD